MQRILRELNVNGDKPEPRSGHRCCATSNHLLVYGGYDKDRDNKLYSGVLCYNTISKKWKEFPASKDLRKDSASSSMALLGDSLIIFGGSGFPFGYSNSGELSVFSLSTKKWLKLDTENPKSTPPLPKYGHSMALTTRGHMPKLYVYSGTTGQYFVDEMHCYDLIENRWYEINTEYAPMSRYRHEVVVYNDSFYMFGGAILHHAFGFDEMWSFSFTTHEWTRQECKPSEDGHFPMPRKAHSCVLWKETVYMCGGLSTVCTTDADAFPCKDIWKISLIDLTWKRVSFVLPTPLYFHSAAVTSDGCMYIFGGVNNKDERSSALYEVWLDVAPLVKLCFEAICKLVGHKRHNQKFYKKHGVPGSLVKRAFQDFPAG